MELEKLHSKKLLLANIGTFNYAAFDTLHNNLTLADIGPLEAFQNLGPVQHCGRLESFPTLSVLRRCLLLSF